MNTKEIGELRRRQRRDRSNAAAVFGCYVNESRQIITQFRQSIGIMPENEAEKYFAIFRRTLGGTIGKNLIDITFSTAQVAGSEEHKLLMELRRTALEDEQIRTDFFQKVVDHLDLDTAYAILLCCDSYDVPFKSGDGSASPDQSDETFTYVLCAICPVKQTKPTLHYIPESREFHDGNMANVIMAPELGFLFPAFDGRATNIYNALYFNKSPRENHAALADALFCTSIPMPAAEQKQAFAALLGRTLEDECSLEVVQSVHDELCQQIAMHKESRVPEPLLIDKEQVRRVLEDCGVSQTHSAKFSVEFDETFGLDAQLHPANVIDHKKLELQTPDVIIKVAPDRGDLLETRVLGGVEYILIRSDENVTVNGVDIHLKNQQEATV